MPMPSYLPSLTEALSEVVDPRQRRKRFDLLPQFVRQKLRHARASLL